MHRHLPCDPLIRRRKYKEASLGPTARKGQGHVYLTLKLMYPCEPHMVALPDASHSTVCCDLVLLCSFLLGGVLFARSLVGAGSSHGLTV